MTTRTPVAILISGRGSNMMSIVNAARTPSFPARVVGVISNRPDAAGLEWARSEGIPAIALDHTAYPSRAAFDDALHEAILATGARLVACAGFMRLMTPGLVERWRDRMLNIHPSLLPSFKGLHTHERALASGVRIAGCTVHFVRPAMDEGPIVAQAAVPVHDGDTPEMLSSRVLRAEHKLYPHALALVAAGLVKVDGEVAKVLGSLNHETSLYSPSLDSAPI